MGRTQHAQVEVGLGQVGVDTGGFKVELLGFGWVGGLVLNGLVEDGHGFGVGVKRDVFFGPGRRFGGVGGVVEGGVKEEQQESKGRARSKAGEQENQRRK